MIDESRLLHREMRVVLVRTGPCFTADKPADRFWRKNTRPLLDDGSCVGVDLNRNWGVAFGGEDEGATSSCLSMFILSIII